MVILTFSLSVDCDCSVSGAVSDVCSHQGQCICKTNVDSSTFKCTQCQDGFWNLTESNSDGCESKKTPEIAIIIKVKYFNLFELVDSEVRSKKNMTALFKPI